MNYFVVANKFGNLTAGVKAREDIETILETEGFQKIAIEDTEEQRLQMNNIKKFFYHFAVANMWDHAFKSLQNGDNVVIQFPVRTHTVFLSQVIKKIQKQKVRFILLIHDLELFRFNHNAKGNISYRLRMEELSVLRQADVVIVHNKAMKKRVIELGVSSEKIIILGIFDYLTDAAMSDSRSYKDKSVVIAGNLNQQKSGYVYRLPGGVRWKLFGPNYEEKKQQNKNVRYMGAFPSDILPEKLDGSFGLVWDGTSVQTCDGVTGRYLKINNPHKTSLYLAAGLPVIIWKKAALADFIQKNNCGFVIDSLSDISHIVDNLGYDEYLEMSENARKLGQKLRKGYFTRRAVRKALII